MQVGSRLMPLAVQKHPACRAPQCYVDNGTIFKKNKRKEKRWNNILIFRPLFALMGGGLGTVDQRHLPEEPRGVLKVFTADTRGVGGSHN